MSITRIPAFLGNKPSFKKTVAITVPTLPNISSLVSNYRKILKSGMITNSKFVQEFESSVKKYLGVKHAIAVNSCTNGLMLILKTLGLKGEVILPSFTFHATAHAVVWNNLKPVFVDCDPETYNINPDSVEKAINSKTAAIIGVYIFGNPPRIDALEKIAKKHKLKLMFDAAHGFGTKYSNSHIGGFGDAESFSLTPTKLLTAGEGGMVTTNDDDLARKIKIGRNYGDPGTYDCEFSGLSARMSEFNALLGIEGLKMLEKNVLQRNKIAKLYKKILSKTPGISFQKIEDGNRSSYKDFSISINKDLFGLSRDQLCEVLLTENIMVKKYFYPAVHKQKAFLKYAPRKDRLFNTNRISDSSLSLPLYSHMLEDEVEKICKVIASVHYYRERIMKKMLSK